jgi:AcrR family transcriptional regulator
MTPASAERSVDNNLRARDEVRRGRRRDPAVDRAIIAATVELLGEVGYAKLTMQQVATRARVGKASLYLRWPGKAQLVTEAIRDRAGVVPEVPNTGSLQKDTDVFLHALLRAKRSGARAVSAVSGEVNSNPQLREVWRRGLAGTIVEKMRTIVVRAVDRGELPSTTDVELMSMLPLALFHYWGLAHDGRPDSAVINRIVDQFYSNPQELKNLQNGRSTNDVSTNGAGR